jgi:fatty-acid desaturase
MKLSRTKVDPIILAIIGMLSPIVTVWWIAINFNFASLSMFLVVAWLIGINTTIFAHRAWTHKSWQPNKYLNVFGLLLFTLTMIGNSVGWVSIHREHHRYSDTEKDPHSPNFKSRLWIQFFPYFNKVKVQYVLELTRDSFHMWFATNYWYVISVWLVVLYMINPATLLFWFAVIGLSSMKMHSINSFGHNTPKWLLPINASDKSCNSVILALINLNSGEAWHRNHHEDPMNYCFGKQWYEIDPAAWMIRLLVMINIATFNTKD